MFQMINESSSSEEAKRLFWYKVGIFFAALAGVAGVMYYVFTGSITT